MSHISTGSGIERTMECRASSVLHRSFDKLGHPGTTRGSEVHAYLQRIGEGMSAEASLELVDERYQDSCTAIDLDDLGDILGLTPEMSFAYSPIHDAARVLGVALDREYESAGATMDEIPLTVDVAGLDNPKAPRVGFVGEFKSGWQRLAPAHRNWQVRGGALALARAFELDEVRVQLIHLREGLPARRDRAVFTAADLAVFSSELRARWVLALDDRARYASTGNEPESTRGSWCKYCPSYHACSATTSLIKAAVNPDEWDDLTRTSPIDRAMIASAYKRLRDIREPLKYLEQSIYAAAREIPVLLEVLPDGTQVWLGLTEKLGQEKLDPDVARDVVREMLGDAAVDKVCTFTVTKGRLEAAVKEIAPRGYAAGKMRTVLGEIRKRGGAHRPTKHEVGVYKTAPRQLAAKAG